MPNNDDVPYPEYLIGKMNMIDLEKMLAKGTQILWQSTGAEYSLFPAIVDEDHPRGQISIIAPDGKKSSIYTEQLKVALIDGKMIPVMSIHEGIWESRLKRRFAGIIIRKP